MNPSNRHITFPLDSFLQKLEAAGFYISPASRLRLLKTLDVTWQQGRKPEDLKYLLAPVIAKSPNEQAKFYDLFDRYLEEIKTPIPFEKEPAWYERVPRWVYYLLPVLFAIYIGFTIWNVYKDLSKPQPEISFVLPEEIRIGDTLNILNTSKNCDTLHTSFEWQIWDEEETTLDRSDSSSFDLQHVFQEVGNNPVKKIKLISFHAHIQERDTFETQFRVDCESPPMVDFELIKNQWQIGERLNVSPTVALSKDTFDYTWNYNSNEVNNVSDFSIDLDSVGIFPISLKVKKKDVEGFCEVNIQKSISVGDNQVVLATNTLSRMESKTTAQFSWVFWLLWLLSLLGLLFFFIRWLRREPIAIEEDSQKKKGGLSNPDRGPYFIPFQNRNGLIKVEPELFRFANVLRQRQEGNRRSVNIPKSLNKTINDGGFPKLVLSSNSRPTEYLFLIEEHSENSHLTQLFKYITGFLMEKEVLIEAFNYNQSFQNFWNKEHPKGLTLDLLRRYFPQHRVVILGGGHHFLDRHSKDLPKLKRSLANVFRQWKQRILITPMPLESWTYKERTLYNLFTIFPADVDGLHDAMAFLEAGLEAEDASTFPLWMEQFEDNAPAPNVNYFKWRKTQEHKDYLKNYPELYQWLTAIAVYPKPNWHLTIAMGKALEPIGVEVNYQSLLILSRINWLTSGRISPRLRREFLKEIDPRVEEIARKTIQKELTAVSHLTENSFSGRALSINSTLNNFALNPHKKDYQNDLKDLMDKGVLTKKHLTEIEQDLEQYFRQRPVASTGTNTGSVSFQEPPRLQEFLAQNQADQEKAPKPFFTNDFWWTAVTGIIFFLFSLLWFANETEQLHQIAFGEPPQTVTNTERADLQSSLFVNQGFEIDSAVLYNNEAVGYWENYEDSRDLTEVLNVRQNSNLLAGSRTTAFRGGLKDSLDLLLTTALDLLGKAVNYNNNFTKADSNWYDLIYNVGAFALNNYQTDSSLIQYAQTEFQAVLDENENHFDALHGKGLVYHLQNERDSVCTIVETLNKSNANIQSSPNLFSVADYCGPNLLYIQVNGSLARNLAPALQTMFVEENYLVPGIENMNRPFKNTVKYFYTDDQKAAEEVAGKLRGYLSDNFVKFKSSEFRAQLLNSNNAKKGQIEIWMDFVEPVKKTPPSKKEEEPKKEDPNLDIEQNTAQDVAQNPPQDSLAQDAISNEPTTTSNGIIIFGNKDAGYGLMDQNQQVILPQTYESIEDFGRVFKDRTLAEVVLKGQHGIINKKGEVIIPPQYEDIIGVEKSGKPFWNLAIVRSNGYLGVINSEGEIVVKSEYSNVSIVNQYNFRLRKDGPYFNVNPSGDMIKEEGGLVRISSRNYSNSSFTDPRDNTTYQTANYNGTTWMVENMKYQTKGSVCYDDNPENCRLLGTLYPYGLMNDVCPYGWHVATDAEWLELIQLVANDSKVHFPLVRNGYRDPNEKGANTYLENIEFWTTENSRDGNVVRYQFKAGGNVNRRIVEKSGNRFCRCVKD